MEDEVQKRVAQGGELFAWDLVEVVGDLSELAYVLSGDQDLPTLPFIVVAAKSFDSLEESADVRIPMVAGHAASCVLSDNDL